MAVHTLKGMALAAVLLAGTTAARAQSDTTGSNTSSSSASFSTKIAPPAHATYDNKYEVYGGFNFMNFQAGQVLPKRMNFAGAEANGLYYLTTKLAVGGDYRFEGGTTPVLANPYVRNRPTVFMHTIMGGAQYRGPKNHYAAINYHAYFGAAHGIFTYSTKNLNDQQFALTGLYTNRTAPMAALGGSVDFNYTKNIAIRLAPDLIIEHFGNETREFVYVSGGIVWRIGKK